MKGMLPELDMLHAQATRDMEKHELMKDYFKHPNVSCFHIKDSGEVTKRLRTLRAEIERHRQLSHPDKSRGIFDHV